MVDMTNKDRPEYGRRELLYDADLLGDLVDQHGNAIEVKEEVKTPLLVEKWHGYEGARGADCEGRLQEEYGMRAYSSWEA